MPSLVGSEMCIRDSVSVGSSSSGSVNTSTDCDENDRPVRLPRSLTYHRRRRPRRETRQHLSTTVGQIHTERASIGRECTQLTRRWVTREIFCCWRSSELLYRIEGCPDAVKSCPRKKYNFFLLLECEAQCIASKKYLMCPTPTSPRRPTNQTFSEVWKANLSLLYAISRLYKTTRLLLSP